MNKWKICAGGIMLWLSVCLLTACGQQASAVSMRLARTEGNVKVADGEGGEIAPAKNLNLYSGYHVGTEAASYAWINLDDVKLTKLDAESEVEVRKEDKNLEIVVNRGNLFFHVTEPLSDEERLEIRINDMAVGIRGTCGWVSAQEENHLQVYILEGTVECRDLEETGEKAVLTAAVSGGEMADLFMTDGEWKVSVRKFSLAEIPEFVQQELEEEESVNDKINETFEMDVREWFQRSVTIQMPVTDLEIQELLEQDGHRTVIVEPGEGDNVLAIANGLTINDGQTLLLRDGIDVVLDGTEEDMVFFSVWGTWKMQGNLFIGGNGFLTNDGMSVMDGNIMDCGILQNYATLIVTGSIEVMPQIKESGDSYCFWSGASLGNLSGYLYIGQGIHSEGEVILQDGARLDGTVTLLKGVREADGRTWDTEGHIRRRDKDGRYIDEE